MDLFVLYLGAFIIGLAKAGFGGGLGMVVTPLWVLVIAPREAIGSARRSEERHTAPHTPPTPRGIRVSQITH